MKRVSDKLPRTETKEATKKKEEKGVKSKRVNINLPNRVKFVLFYDHVLQRTALFIFIDIHIGIYNLPYKCTMHT